MAIKEITYDSTIIIYKKNLFTFLSNAQLPPLLCRIFYLLHVTSCQLTKFLLKLRFTFRIII